SASDGQPVQLWDAESGILLKSLSRHTASVRCVAWSLDARRLAAVSDDGSCSVWDWESGEVLRTFRGPSALSGLSWLANGGILAPAGWEKVIGLWDTTSGGEVAVLTGHTACVTDLAAAADGRVLSSVSWDGTVRLWRLDTHGLLATLAEKSPRRFHAGPAF